MIGYVFGQFVFRSICRKCDGVVEFEVIITPSSELEKTNQRYLCPSCGSPFHFETQDVDGDFWKLMVYQEVRGETEPPEPKPSRMELLRQK